MPMNGNTDVYLLQPFCGEYDERRWWLIVGVRNQSIKNSCNTSIGKIKLHCQ